MSEKEASIANGKRGDKKEVFIGIGVLVVFIALFALIATTCIYLAFKPTEVELARQDIDKIMRGVAAGVFAANLDTANPMGYKDDEVACGKNGESCSSWGEWTMRYIKLDSDKWAFSNNALSPKAKSGELCGYIIEFVQTTLRNPCDKNSLDLVFDINKIESDDRFCQELRASYQIDKTKRTIPLDGGCTILP